MTLTQMQNVKIAEELLISIYCNRDDRDSEMYRSAISTAIANEDTATIVKMLKNARNICDKLIDGIELRDRLTIRE